MRFLHRIFTIKQVPSVSWRSEFPLNTKPRFITLLMLIIGLFLFGLGEAIIIGSGSGVSPWTVLAQGISSRSNLSIGMTTFLISVSILIFWIPLKQVPGIGTILNAIIIASAIDLTLPYLPHPDSMVLKMLQAYLDCGNWKWNLSLQQSGSGTKRWFNGWTTEKNRRFNSHH